MIVDFLSFTVALPYIRTAKLSYRCRRQPSIVNLFSSHHQSIHLNDTDPSLEQSQLGRYHPRLFNQPDLASLPKQIKDQGAGQPSCSALRDL